MKNTQRIAPKIPDGMVELLKNLAKSILKEQPDDIYVFAAEYFENLVRQRDGGALDKSYGKFRKYSDLEITQLNGIDVCPRCHCTLHPIRNALIEPPDYNAPSTSPKNTDLAITAAPDDDNVGDDNNENALDMSVNGVAIKALPRDGKSLKNNQKNRQRLETIRSVDSAIDDDVKSQSSSPKSNEGSASEKKTDSAKHDTNANDIDNANTKPTAIISTISEKTVVKGAAAAAAIGGAAAAAAVTVAEAATESQRVKRHDDIEIEDSISKTPPNDVHIEQISSLKTDDDIDSSPNETTTTTTSVSEANTDRTVIEAGAPLNIEPNEINKSEEIITVVTKPIDDQQESTNAAVTVSTDDVDNVQLNNVKQMDRLRTPESDSGLSEKSFNLALQENAETISNEINNVKSEVITTTTTKTMTTTTMSESTVEKIQVKSNEIDDVDEKQNQYEKELNMKNELLSSASSPPPPPSPTEPEKPSSVAESTEIVSQARKSIETIKTEEITEMKKVEVKSATKQEIAKTVEKIDTTDFKPSKEADLTESQGEKTNQQKSTDAPTTPPSPTTSEKSITIEQKIEQPEITSTETSKIVEISSESKDDKHEKSMTIKEMSSSAKTIASSEEQSEKMETITSHTRSKRASDGSASIDNEKQSVSDVNNETMESDNFTEERTEKASDGKTEIVEVNLETNDEKTTNEAEKIDVGPIKEPTPEESGESTKKSEVDQPTPIEIVSSSEKQTIERTKSTQETTESKHHEHQQMEVKSEAIESVTETTAADDHHIQHTTISTEEKSTMEQKSIESESKHSHSVQVITKISEKSEASNELTEKDDGKQSDGIASEVNGLIGESSNVTQERDLIVDEIDKTVINIDEKDDSKEQIDSNKTTITTADRVEKYTEQPADVSSDGNNEKSQPGSSDKNQTEKVELSSEKLVDETELTGRKLSETESIKMEEQHTIVEHKSDASSSKHIETTEQSTTIVEVKEADKIPDELVDDRKKQDDEEHKSTTRTEEETSINHKSNEDESKSAPATIEQTIVQTEKIEKSSTEETKEHHQQQQKEEVNSTIKTNVVESVVTPIASTETENIKTQEKLSDKSIEKDEEDSNSWEKVTEQIAEHVHEHDGNQIKATAPLLTDITDDGNSSSKIDVVDQNVHIETMSNDQTEQNNKITTISINSDVVEALTKEKDIKIDDSIDKSIVETSIVSAQNEMDEKIHANDEDESIKKDKPDSDMVSESKEVVSSDLSVTINEPNVMDEQGKENITIKSATMTATVDDNVNKEEETTTTSTTNRSSSSKIEGDLLQESKDTLKTVEIETKSTVLSTPQQITIDPIAAVIETNITETKEISSIDPSKAIETAVNNTDNEEIGTNIDLQQTLTETIATTSGVGEEEKKEVTASTTTTTTTIEQHEQNEPNKNVIENNDSNLTQPENESSTTKHTEAVKENLAVESSNNLNGMNNNNNNDSATIELSAMPTTSKIDEVTEVDSKNDESSPSTSNEKMHTATTTIITTNENSLTKTFIENEQQNSNVVVAASGAVAVATAAAAAVVDNYDIKSNNNDDMGSESSAKDEYEQAVTRSVGDESEKELLNLSLINDMESNQVNDSVDLESQPQITTEEIVKEPSPPPPQQIDLDSIDTAELKKVPMQPDSLDVSNEMEPSVEADSLNIDDSSEEKSRSARSIDATATTSSADKKLPIASTDQSQDQIIKIDDTHELPLVRDVSIEIENKIDALERNAEDKAAVIMGDIIDIDTNAIENMNDQMRSELNILELDEKSPHPDAKEVTLDIAPKPSATMVIETISNDKSDTIEEKTNVDEHKSSERENEQSEKVPESHETTLVVKSDDSGNIEINQETSKSTEETDREDDAKKIDVSARSTTNDTVKRSIDIEEIKEDKNVTDKADKKIEESSVSAALPAVAAAAAAAGALGTIITTESVTKSIKESQSTQHHNEETKTMAMSETVVQHARTMDDNIDAKANANDLPSSDFSDTETTTDKAEKMYTESGVDETSRDEYERDEVSEIENFDLSSCGEDSLEAMYYMIRKNEIIMDRSHKEGSTATVTKVSKEDERISKSFPEKATDELEQAVREVSGKKKVKLVGSSIGSMDSSMDDVVLKKMSSDSDELQLHVIPNSEIESSVVDGGSDSDVSEPKKRLILIDKVQSTVNESTDDEYIHSNLRSMQKNSSDEFDEAAAVAAAATVAALSFQTSQSDSQSDDQHHNETDTFDEHQMVDMIPGNIERKILASSISDGDGDSDGGGGVGRLTKDNFNVSTAFEHMIRTDSITEESDTTIESAATKIQAGARGFLTRRRNRQSDGSTGTSMSMEKGSSIGNAAIDKSMENLIENKRELHEETSSTVYSESFEESSERTHSRQMLYDQTIDSLDSEKVLGITEIKVEHRKDDEGHEIGGDGDSEKVPDINIQGISEESASRRRQMLQRGDAMQRNSSAEQQSQQIQQDDKEEKQTEIAAAQTARASVKTDSTIKNSSKKIGKPTKRVLGVRQRSMPVQIDTQLIRILPKHMKKRVKSASLEKSSKANVRRPSFF